MNSIWNKNYSLFKSRFPGLASMLPSPDLNLINNPPFWIFSQSRNGMITCTENNLRLHSAYNPEREALTGISNKEIEEKSTTVFYGFGLGYHIVQWAKKFISSDKKLIIIEPDYKRFYAALNILDWSEVFQLKNLILAINCPTENILSLIEDTTTINIGNTGVSDAYFFTIPAFIDHAKEYFSTVNEIVLRNKKKNDINAATLKKFGKLWCKNSLKNIHLMRELSCVKDVKSFDKTSLPFLVIGAGPSLEKILPYIKELKKRCVIVCVETALRALLRFGVQPDFIVLTDPQFWAYRHIAGLESLDSILVTEISTYPSVFRFPCKKILLSTSQFPIGQYFQMKMNIDMGDLGTGGSVASCAWNLAHLWNAKEIFVAGLDFAFPENKTHIKGSSAEETLCSINNKLNTLDNYTLKSLYSANAQEGKDYNGKPVITDSRMKMFSWWFESKISKCNNIKTYTLCPEGLNTPGIIPKDIKQLLEYEDITKIKNEAMKNIDTLEPAVKKDIVSKFKKLIREFPDKEFLVQFSFLKEYL